jgi:hypothetical protein
LEKELQWWRFLEEVGDGRNLEFADEERKKKKKRRSKNEEE